MPCALSDRVAALRLDHIPMSLVGERKTEKQRYASMGRFIKKILSALLCFYRGVKIVIKDGRATGVEYIQDGEKRIANLAPGGEVSSSEATRARSSTFVAADRGFMMGMKECHFPFTLLDCLILLPYCLIALLPLNQFAYSYVSRSSCVLVWSHT